MLETAKARVLIAVTVSAAMSSCAPVGLPNSQTASEQFSVLGYHEKAIARNFYDLGSGDAMKRLYWAQRNLEQYHAGGLADAPPPTGRLQRKYVVLPVPDHVDPDGTAREASNQVVEVVQ
jgi:hypothetical protein